MDKTKPIPELSEKQIKRFWSRIFVKEHSDECWEWERKINHSNGYGYGQFYLNNQTYRANRIAYLLGKKEDPIGMFVCHKCDNPKCCNPNHLFLGTQEDNVKDCVAKGRHAIGDKHGSVTKPGSAARGDKSGPRLHPETIIRGSKRHNAKLTDVQIKEIMGLYAKGGMSQQKIGDIYGVSGSNIGWIVRGSGWTHTEVKTESYEDRQLKCKMKLREVDVLKIREMFVGGKGGNIGELSVKFNVSKPLIHNIAKGRIWKHILPKTG